MTILNETKYRSISDMNKRKRDSKQSFALRKPERYSIESHSEEYAMTTNRIPLIYDEIAIQKVYRLSTQVNASAEWVLGAHSIARQISTINTKVTWRDVHTLWQVFGGRASFIKTIAAAAPGTQFAHKLSEHDRLAYLSGRRAKTIPMPQRAAG